MTTTDKRSVQILTSLLAAHGITDAVVSPGTRNVPIVMSLKRCPSITTHCVIDERSAAFIALGIADISARPVALVCTSGTALLNYAPAVAEAYYRHIPLIVISADRPVEWIDQDDSQTLRQPGALANFTKATFNIAYDSPTDTQQWYINRRINDAILCAMSGARGPVHINISLDEPLNGTIDTCRAITPDNARRISLTEPTPRLSADDALKLAEELSGRRVMVIVGFHAPDTRLNEALKLWSDIPGVVIMHEAQSNLRHSSFIDNIDGTLSRLPASTDAPEETLRPDIIITMGGSLVSRMIKRHLRRYRDSDTEHWSIGLHDHAIDCFKGLLTRRIAVDEAAFAADVFKHITPGQATPQATLFDELYSNASALAHREAYAMAQSAPWTDFVAFSIIAASVPADCNVQVSNGTAIRYMQLFATDGMRRIDCNRGVSGIDGCTSTAIGASLAHTSGSTLLITGDMSAQYDLGALASTLLTPRLKIIVINNGGGGIFRYIPSTRDLPERESILSGNVNLPLEHLAEAFDFAYYKATDRPSLITALDDMYSQTARPAILEVVTPSDISTDILDAYFSAQ